MATALNTLVLSLVPAARRDERLRADLTEDSLHILNSHIGSSRQVDIGHISANIRAKCLYYPIFSYFASHFASP